MRILHVPYGYFPTVAGGTEVYVAALCRELATLGVTNAIAAPGNKRESWRYEGVPVHGMPTCEKPSFQQMHSGEGDAVAAGEFARVLDEVQPEVVHFHAFSAAVSTLCLAAAKARGLPVVYTYHSPTATCTRGTMMRWGSVVCDGRLDALRCAACALHSIGVPQWLSVAAANLSPLTQWLAPCLPDTARWQLPLRATPLMQSRQELMHAWLRAMDAVVALNQWSHALLLDEGVAAARLQIVRHGLANAPVTSTVEPSPRTGPVRLALLGRLDPTKGIALIVEALGQLPTVALTLDLYLVGDQDTAFARQVLALVAHDARVHVLPPLPPVEVVAALRRYDALLVPSQVKETGPLVVLEAFAAGIPVLGSDLGGIAEWVQHEMNGLLVEPGSPRAWCAALQRLSDRSSGLLARLQQGVQSPRTFAEVASEMMVVYKRVLAAG